MKSENLTALQAVVAAYMQIFSASFILFRILLYEIRYALHPVKGLLINISIDLVKEVRNRGFLHSTKRTNLRIITKYFKIKCNKHLFLCIDSREGVVWQDHEESLNSIAGRYGKIKNTGVNNIAQRLDAKRRKDKGTNKVIAN